MNNVLAGSDAYAIVHERGNGAEQTVGGAKYAIRPKTRSLEYFIALILFRAGEASGLVR